MVWGHLVIKRVVTIIIRYSHLLITITILIQLHHRTLWTRHRSDNQNHTHWDWSRTSHTSMTSTIWRIDSTLHQDQLHNKITITNIVNRRYRGRGYQLQLVRVWRRWWIIVMMVIRFIYIMGIILGVLVGRRWEWRRLLLIRASIIGTIFDCYS